MISAANFIPTLTSTLTSQFNQNQFYTEEFSSYHHEIKNMEQKTGDKTVLSIVITNSIDVRE